MNKKMREILDDIEAKTKEARTAQDANDTKKASDTLNEIFVLKKSYEIEKALYDVEAQRVQLDVTPQADDQKKSKAIKLFADDARNYFKGMNEGTNASGGYTVPVDIVTKIEQYRDAEFSLRSLVRATTVKTNTGARTFRIKSIQTGFTEVGEGSAIGEKGTPTYEQITYKIKKYGGYMPVSNELLEDSDENIVNELTQWLGGEARATDNALISAQLLSNAQTNLNNIDGIKKAINVTLGAAYKNYSKIVTNDDGLQYLDTLKDGTGKGLLVQNPTNPLEMRLSVGALSVPIIVVPNAVLSTTASKVPFIVGDFNEAIQIFDLKQFTIKTSDVAVVGSGNTQINAFEDDMTLFRGLLREDVVVRDKNALVNGYITVA